MKKLLVGLLALMSISCFSSDTFSLKISSNKYSSSDIYDYMGNVYGRTLSAIIDGKSEYVTLICFVDPNLSDAYENKLLPGALVDCGVAVNGAIHNFSERLDITELLEEIDSNEGMVRTVSLSKDITFRIW